MDAPKEKAFDIAVSGHNLFLGGQAGTGKTHLLGCIRDHLVSMGKRVAVTCTTGIGCSSISARCLPKTIHSWSGIDDGRVTTKDREQTLPSTCALATEVIERQEELVEDDSIDDTVLSTIMCSSESDNPPESEIPQGFDVCVVLEDLIIKEMCTKAQHETNDTINELITNHKESVSEFCSGEFMYIRDMIEVLQINENDPKPVQGEKMTELYKNCQKHQTSTCYRARTYLMFFDMQAVSQQVMAHICFNITTSIRKFLLKEKELLYKVGEHGMQKRQVTTESQVKIRYVGGYCVAKLRQKYHKQTSMYCFRSEEGDQFKYEQAKTLCQLLDGLSLKEHIVEKTTSFPKTLIETSIRQNVTRGLTSISDRFFHFFIAVCERCLALLVEKNLNVHGEQLFQMCIREITIDRELHEEFVKCVASNKYADFVPDENISYVMHEMLNTVSAMDQLFSEFVDKFLMVMLNQFRKDFLSCLTVKKKMAHRKQIQVSKTSHKGVISKVNFDFILNDQSPGKSVSNNFLKGFICQDSTFLNCMKKQELLTLCKAYDCLTKSKDNKGAIIQRLNSAILKSKETIPKHQILSEQDIPIETVTESQSTVASSPTASCSTQSEYCIVCNKIEGHRQWIQCEKCNGWLHRDCAGLKQQKKWGAIAKKNAVFSCQKCTE